MKRVRRPIWNDEMRNFVRGAIVGGNEKAAQQDLLRYREWGTITSQKPRNGLVTVHWHRGAYERWHIDLLEVIDLPDKLPPA